MTQPSPKSSDPIPPGIATIRVTCAGIGPVLTVRVRRVLKHLLRTHGLKCISCELPQEAGAK